MIPGQALARLQLDMPAMTILAAVTVASEKESIRDLATKAAGNVDELDEADDDRFGQGQPGTSNEIEAVGLDDLCLSLDDETKRPTHGYHGQRFERRIESEAAQRHLPWEVSWMLMRLEGYGQDGHDAGGTDHPGTA